MKHTSEKVSYTLGRSGEFIIENYNCAKPFASFFPGIAGPHGIPMWVFYVNRAQCVCSIGIEDKELQQKIVDYRKEMHDHAKESSADLVY